MTLYKNGASTGSSCTIGNSQTGCTISGLNLSVNGSDTIVLAVSRTSGSGTSYTGNGSASATAQGSWSSGNWYTSVSASCASQTAGSCNTTPAAGTISSASFNFATAIGASSSYTVTLYKNGATTGSSCTIGGSQTGCTISGLSLAVNGTSDTVVLVVSRTAGTTYTGNASASISTSVLGRRQLVRIGLLELRKPDGGKLHHDPACGNDQERRLQLRLGDRGYLVVLGDPLQERRLDRLICTIGNSQTSCTISGLNVAVNGTSDTVVLVVTRTSGTGTSYAGTASASAAHSTPPVAGQIAFNVPSGSGYTITAWGASTSSQLTGQTVTAPTTKTMTVS